MQLSDDFEDHEQVQKHVKVQRTRSAEAVKKAMDDTNNAAPKSKRDLEWERKRKLFLQKQQQNEDDDEPQVPKQKASKNLDQIFGNLPNAAMDEQQEEEESYQQPPPPKRKNSPPPQKTPVKPVVQFAPEPIQQQQVFHSPSEKAKQVLQEQTGGMFTNLGNYERKKVERNVQFYQNEPVATPSANNQQGKKQQPTNEDNSFSFFNKMGEHERNQQQKRYVQLHQHQYETPIDVKQTNNRKGENNTPAQGGLFDGIGKDEKYSRFRRNEPFYPDVPPAQYGNSKPQSRHSNVEPAYVPSPAGYNQQQQLSPQVPKYSHHYNQVQIVGSVCQIVTSNLLKNVNQYNDQQEAKKRYAQELSKCSILIMYII